MSQQDFDLLLQKYLSGKCSVQEESAVLEWYKRLIQESRIDISASDKAELEAKIWSKISSTVDASDTKIELAVAKPRIVRLYKVAAAASLIGLIALGVLFYKAGDHRPATPGNTGQALLSSIPGNYLLAANNADTVQPVLLADGSLIQLQPKSILHYPAAFAGNSREVYLTGTAFFDVTHDRNRRFIVHANELTTEVLGTSFWVAGNAVMHEIEVSVVTGKVSVYEKRRDTVAGIPSRAGVVLIPNQKATFNELNNRIVTALVDKPVPLQAPGNAGDPISFVFNEATVGTIVAKLNKAYGIEISCENAALKSCHFTGDLTKQDLYQKLNIICESTQSSYERIGTSILIKGSGCK